MSYEIHYGADRPRRKRVGIIIAAALLLLAAVRLCASGAITQALARFAPNETVRSFGSFVENMRQGSSFAEAAAAFCREIVDNAKLDAA